MRRLVVSLLVLLVVAVAAGSGKGKRLAGCAQHPLGCLSEERTTAGGTGTFAFQRDVSVPLLHSEVFEVCYLHGVDFCRENMDSLTGIYNGILQMVQDLGGALGGNPFRTFAVAKRVVGGDPALQESVDAVKAIKRRALKGQRDMMKVTNALDMHQAMPGMPQEGRVRAAYVASI